MTSNVKPADAALLRKLADELESDADFFCSVDAADYRMDAARLRALADLLEVAQQNRPAPAYLASFDTDDK